MKDIPEFTEEFIANYLDGGNLPTMSDQYCFQRQIYWNQIYEEHHMVNPGDRPSLEDVRACIEKKDKKQLTIQFGLGQAIALETCDRKMATGGTQNNNKPPENDGTFICLKIPEKSSELQPVSDEEIANNLRTLSTFSLRTFYMT